MNCNCSFCTPSLSDKELCEEMTSEVINVRENKIRGCAQKSFFLKDMVWLSKNFPVLWTQ